MHSHRIILSALLLGGLIACSAGNPHAAGDSTHPLSNSPGISADAGATMSDSDASADDDEEQSDAGTEALDAADAFDGFYPPPKSECNPNLTIGAPSTAKNGARFAGITRDELTIAWTAPNDNGKTSLFVADRDDARIDFAGATTISVDAASDGVALSDDGLTMYAVTADHRNFVVYERASRDDDFELGDDTVFDPVVEALAPEERIGDPVFVNSGLVLLYSRYGKSADTMRMANRISIHASFYPAYTLAFDQFRATGDARRRPTGTGEDFQVIFYWDEVSKTEKLARLNGTEMILSVKDLGPHAWAQANAGCTRIYFGAESVASAPAY